MSYADLLEMIHPDDLERMKATLDGSVVNNTEYVIEYRFVMPSGEVRWIEVRGQPFYASDVTPLSMVCVSLDITDRKRGEEHRALLADELNHWVKNSMATMQAIAHQTLANAGALADAPTTLDARLQSLSAAHDVLTRKSWEGATLAEIAEGALQPFRQGDGKRFKIGGPPVRLSPRHALTFVMALHELATNAVKYGALSDAKGRVILNWDIVDEDMPGHPWVRWEEIGGPPVTPPQRKGFGSRMIERALTAELGGTAEIDYRPHGLVCTVEAPMPGKGVPVPS